MKPPKFEYHAPEYLQNALELLVELEGARVLAGGQTLMPMLNFRIAAPAHLIDLGHIEELRHIVETPDMIRIGAMTTQRRIEFSDTLRRRLPLLVKAIGHVGHRQTRNRGTIGGSLSHLDPSAELPLLACVYDAGITIASAERGTRTLGMPEFAHDMMETDLAEDEVLTEVRFEPWPEGHGWGFEEYARRHGDFAIAAAAALIDAGPDGRIRRVALAVGGVAPTPQRIPAAEELLCGVPGEVAPFERAAVEAAQLDAMDDAYTPAWYRRRVASTLAERALRSAWARAREADVGLQDRKPHGHA